MSKSVHRRLRNLVSDVTFEAKKRQPKLKIRTLHIARKNNKWSQKCEKTVMLKLFPACLDGPRKRERAQSANGLSEAVMQVCGHAAMFWCNGPSPGNRRRAAVVVRVLAGTDAKKHALYHSKRF